MKWVMYVRLDFLFQSRFFCLFLISKIVKRYCLWINKSFKNDIDVAAAALKYAKIFIPE
jgi:hypothetical protein